MQVILYFFAFIGLFTTVLLFSQEPKHKEVCQYKNNYNLNDHRACLIKNGCGSDGSLCSEDNYPYCPEPVVICKLVKIQN